jgi:MFS family permease
MESQRPDKERRRVQDNRPGLRRAAGALQYRNYRLFYTALLVAAVGVQIQNTANLWQIYELTGSALHLGLTGLARAIPVIALSLIGGVIADRVDRRRLIALTQAAAGLTALTLATLTALGRIEVWHIYAATVVAALMQTLAQPARTAIIPSLVPRHHLLNALALNTTINELATILGPSVAGLGIAAFGLVPVYLVNGLAHVVTISTLLLIRMAPVAAGPRESPLASLMAGLRFVRERSIILVMVGMDSAANLLGTYRVLLPLFAAQFGFGAEGLGFLLSAPAVGALLGASALMSQGNVRYKGLVAAGSLMVYCGALILLAWSPWFAVALLACGLLGFTDAVQRVARATIIQSVTPDALRGRVASVQFTVTAGSPALGQLTSGALATVVGPSAALVMGAVSCIAILAGFVAARHDLRDPDLASTMEPEPEPTPAVGGAEATRAPAAPSDVRPR